MRAHRPHFRPPPAANKLLPLHHRLHLRSAHSHVITDVRTVIFRAQPSVLSVQTREHAASASPQPERDDSPVASQEEQDILAARYENLDERLDALEYHVMQLTKELRLSQGSDGSSKRRSRSNTASQPSGQNDPTPAGFPSSSSPQGPSPESKLQDVLAAIADIRRLAAAPAKDRSSHGKDSSRDHHSDAPSSTHTAGKSGPEHTPAAPTGQRSTPPPPSTQATPSSGNNLASASSPMPDTTHEHHRSHSPSHVDHHTPPAPETDSTDSTDTAATDTASTQQSAVLASSTSPGGQQHNQGDKENHAKGEDKEKEKEKQKEKGSVLTDLTGSTMYEFNRLQAGMVELMNSGLIESVKQLRETLMIQEWDMSNKQQAKRRAVARFEHYVVEHNLVTEVGGYQALSALYEDPDSLETSLPNDKLRMMARSMMEASMHEMRMAVYQTCTQTAKEMASLTVRPPGAGGFSMGSFMQVLGMMKSRLLPFLRLAPLARLLPLGAVLASVASAVWAALKMVPFLNLG